MELKEAIYTRRSMRAYQDKPVERELIEQVIDAAIQAPTGMNGQPWAFAVVQDKNILRGLSEKTKAFLLSSMDKFSWLENYRMHLENPDFDVFYNAAALVVICGKPNTGPIAQIDCALAAENLMLAARELGLGSCWIGFAGLYLSTPSEKEAIGIPGDYSVVAPIILGYPQAEFFQMERNPPEMLFWK